MVDEINTKTLKKEIGDLWNQASNRTKQIGAVVLVLYSLALGSGAGIIGYSVGSYLNSPVSARASDVNADGSLDVIVRTRKREETLYNVGEGLYLLREAAINRATEIAREKARELYQPK